MKLQRICCSVRPIWKVKINIQQNALITVPKIVQLLFNTVVIYGGFFYIFAHTWTCRTMKSNVYFGEPMDTIQAIYQDNYTS